MLYPLELRALKTRRNTSVAVWLNLTRPPKIGELQVPMGRIILGAGFPSVGDGLPSRVFSNAFRVLHSGVCTCSREAYENTACQFVSVACGARFRFCRAA